MTWNVRTKLLSLLAIFAFSMSPAFAADYDESVDGDLLNLADGPTLFDVEPGSNSVSGIVGDADFEDFLAFTIEPGETLDSVTMDDFVFANGNVSTGFRLYTDQGGGYFQASTGLYDGTQLGQNYLTIWDLADVGGSAPLPPGNYGIVLAEFTAGQEYTYSIGVSAIPEPGSFAGMLFGLVGIAGILRRRK